MEIINDTIQKGVIKPINKLHQLSPYVGKIRPELATYLIKNYCPTHGTIWDPYCGSGTIPFEAWTNGHNIFATDLNLYAYILTLGKLNPPSSIAVALENLKHYNELVIIEKPNFVSSSLPEWIHDFFHPQTLIEINIWTKLLHENKEWFFLSCLMGILHHQRPGFLSYPCSHGAPYLRSKKYPKELFPEMYDYRNVYTRLKKKITRTLDERFKNNYNIKRGAFLQSAFSPLPGKPRINTIITSPPYMKALTYARDNRLRLWFLGLKDWKSLDKTVSPNKSDFKELMKKSFLNWSSCQLSGDKCILIIGDMLIEKNPAITLSEYITMIAEANNYKLIKIFRDPIPEARKIVKGNNRIKSEHICIFEKI